MAEQGRAAYNPAQVMEGLVTAHGDSLLRLCFLYLRDRHLAEDALQDTYVKAYRALDSFRGDSEAVTWLTRIAINVCKDMSRSAWMRRVDLSRALEDLPLGTAPYEPEDDTLVRAVMALPEKQRSVILLYYYQGLKIPQIARVQGMPESTVSSHLQRARKRLHKALKGWYADEKAFS